MDVVLPVVVGFLSAVLIRVLFRRFVTDVGNALVGDVLAAIVGSVVMGFYFLPAWTEEARIGTSTSGNTNIVGMSLISLFLLLALIGVRIFVGGRDPR